MRVVQTNQELVLYPDPADTEKLDELVEATTYKVEGAEFTQEFACGFWDGRTSLIRKLGRSGNRKAAPVGLIGEVLDRFPDAQVEDKRRRPDTRLKAHLDPAVIPSLRPYQEAAVKAVLEPCELEEGKGLIRIPTRGGKTVVAGEVFARTGLRGVFIVNSDMLMGQTVRFFEKVLRYDDAIPGDLPAVGQWGSGVNQAGWVTVMSVQSIIAHLGRPADDPLHLEVLVLLRRADVAFFDECHHLEANLWRKAMTMADAFYKVGLSATIYIDREGGTAKGTIWLVGATGPVIYSLTPSDLIELGWLCRPTVVFHTAPWPTFDPEGSWQRVYRDGIVENDERNALISQLAEEEVRDLGARVLITIKQVKHAKLMREALEGRGLTAGVITGKTASSKRDSIVERVRTGDLDVLLGTVFGEAVDLPWLDTVIVAGGHASKVLTMQRLRNLTPFDRTAGKVRLTPMDPPDDVRVHDFADVCHKTLKRHSRDRLRTYASNRAFRIAWAGKGETP